MDKGRYRRGTDAPLRVLDFGDESVVFNDESWETHVLNAAAVAVLDFVGDAPRSEEEVAQFVAEMIEQEEAQRAADHARDVLGELCALHLIVRT